jgi:hypothetical protein
MYCKSFFLALGLLAASGAWAADTAPPNGAAKEAKPLARRVLAPSVHVMRATRQADGTLAVDCVQRPNPLVIKPDAPNSPRKNGGEP